MSFILWYKIQIEEEDAAGGLAGLAGTVASLLGTALPLKVSNDVFSGQYILDADVRLTMASGPTASTFDLTLTNLPMDAKNLLQSKHADGLRDHKPLHVKIFLGYFDEGAQVISGGLSSTLSLKGSTEESQFDTTKS